MSEPTIRAESPDQPELRQLLAASDVYYATLYPSESNHLLDVGSLMKPNVHFLVARSDEGLLLGCGAIMLNAKANAATAEIKRMWVVPEARGTGLGRRLLQALETKALAQDVKIVRLETGVHQAEAIGLYQSAGFAACAPFDDYQADPLSIFMQKSLSRSISP